MARSKRNVERLKSIAKAEIGDDGKPLIEDEDFQRKLAELDERIARAQAARDAISHGLRCPRRAATQRPDFQAVCPDFQARISPRRAGQPVPPTR